MRRSRHSERRTPQQWAALVEAYKDGKESQRAFCAEHGIGQSSLRYWLRRLELEAGASPATLADRPRLVPVHLIEQETPQAAGSGVAVIMSGGVRIEVKRHFDAEVLRRVVATLEAGT